jgi:hypothetical protein
MIQTCLMTTRHCQVYLSSRRPKMGVDPKREPSPPPCHSLKRWAHSHLLGPPPTSKASHQQVNAPHGATAGTVSDPYSRGLDPAHMKGKGGMSSKGDVHDGCATPPHLQVTHCEYLGMPKSGPPGSRLDLGLATQIGAMSA